MIRDRFAPQKDDLWMRKWTWVISLDLEASLPQSIQIAIHTKKTHFTQLEFFSYINLLEICLFEKLLGCFYLNKKVRKLRNTNINCLKGANLHCNRIPSWSKYQCEMNNHPLNLFLAKAHIFTVTLSVYGCNGQC